MLYLKKLNIKNVRCFGPEQPIDFTGTDGKISQWTVILGDNGTGKTTILKSIASLLPSPQSFLKKGNVSDGVYQLSINDTWRNLWDIKHKDTDASSSISLQIVESKFPFGVEEERTASLRFESNKNQKREGLIINTSHTYDTKIFSPVFCFAYGASRKMGTKSLSGENLLKANETLFNEEALLQNSEEYFLQIDYENAKQKKGSVAKNKVKNLLLKILPSGVKDIRVTKIGPLQREVQVETPYGWVGLNEMSLGYKTTIAWLVDFATKMIYYHPKSKSPFSEPAILLIDEIDLHMHPAWQKQIISKLTHVFPNTQFIATAHSPLVAQAALNSNLVLLKRARDHVKVINEPEVIKNWRIDQILTSDLFGLESARPPKTAQLIKKRDNLLQKSDLTKEDKAELNRLDKAIGYLPFGETPEEETADSIINALAQKLKNDKKI